MFELYTDDNKSKYSSNPKDIPKSSKKIMKLCTKRTSIAATTEFVKFLTERKNLINTLDVISSDEIITFINSEINNKPPGNDGLTGEFHRHFSNELSPVLLGVYDS